ncbi:hypothetical protein [uncultured Mucilaginibacter sp.]|uniref:hypothetical protein n=1 Tax=uncultured Mucilaginibacter sp. TaxID=797541 RepID=UPI0025EE7EA0|nr:hypothetical protein [uncultured Mucilaginibacter sp.]
MNKLLVLSISLLIFSTTVNAQTSKKTDYIYCLIDTAGTPENARMWNIGIEGPFKCFAIECPCLEYGREPTLFYRLPMQGQIITREQLNKFHLISLVELIKKAKQVTDKKYDGDYVVYIIEPDASGYIVHETQFITPIKDEATLDYSIVHPDSLKLKKH